MKVWSSGHDVYELPAGGRDPLGWDDPLRELIRTIEECPAPVIAVIEGGVWGGACEVVFACDLIVAAPSATFAVTPAKLGVPYNVSGMLTFMNACPMRIVKEMVFTAKPISAQRAESLGIINHMVPAKDLDPFARAIAETIAQNAPLSISVMKEQLRMLAGAHPMSPRRFERVQGCDASFGRAKTTKKVCGHSNKSESRDFPAVEPLGLSMKTVQLADAISHDPRWGSHRGRRLSVGRNTGRIMDELVRQRKRDLTLIANDTARPGVGVGKLIDAKCVRHIIVSHIGTNPETQRQMMADEITVELVPQGTLIERIRAGG